MPTKLPQAPRGLTDKAKRLWTETVRNFDLAAHELLILEGACREFSLADRLEREIARLKTLTVKGSMGQPEVSKLVTEVRQHRQEFTRQVKALRLPEESDAKGEKGAATSRTVSAREAAQARWRMPV